MCWLKNMQLCTYKCIVRSNDREASACCIDLPVVQTYNTYNYSTFSSTQHQLRNTFSKVVFHKYNAIASVACHVLQLAIGAPVFTQCLFTFYFLFARLLSTCPRSG